MAFTNKCAIHVICTEKNAYPTWEEHGDVRTFWRKERTITENFSFRALKSIIFLEFNNFEVNKKLLPKISCDILARLLTVTK